jgi:hypothetical protein
MALVFGLSAMAWAAVPAARTTPLVAADFLMKSLRVSFMFLLPN